jgi:hypothetical protein
MAPLLLFVRDLLATVVNSSFWQTVISVPGLGVAPRLSSTVKMLFCNDIGAVS